MPKQDNRGSLMNLKTTLPQIDTLTTTEEMEERIMGGAAGGRTIRTFAQEDDRKDVSKAVKIDDNTDVKTSATFSSFRHPSGIGRNSRREGTILLNAKIPLSLHTRLKRTSQFNDVSMTDILLRGIETELGSGRYSLPPDTWGTD